MLKNRRAAEMVQRPLVRNRLGTYVQRLRKHELAKNASWLMVGQGGNFLLQAAYFMLLARVLGVVQYGIFAGAYALVNAVTPYCGLGAGLLFMRYVSLDRKNAPVYWGNALVSVVVMSAMIAFIYSGIGPSI